MPDASPHPDRRPILVPIDFSAHSAAALLFAAQLAQCNDTPLLILHAVHESPGAPRYRQAHVGAGPWPPLQEVARRMLDDFVADLRERYPALRPLHGARSQLVDGLPATRIIEVATQQRAVLIVLGSHGRTGVSRLLLGSVAEQVAQHSNVPVTIIKAPRNGWDPLDLERLGSNTPWGATSAQTAQALR